MTDEVTLCNRALAAIGTRSTISSIQPSDGSKEANACALLYYPTRDELLRAAHWDFARNQITLSQLKSSSDTNSTCPVPWGFEYAYPSDCLKMRYILPFMDVSNPGTVPFMTSATPAALGLGYWGNPVRFVVATDKNTSGNDSTVLLTNQAQAIGVYTKQITNPDLFDSQFQSALVEALGAKLVPALSLNLSLMKLKIATAEAIIGQARLTNGNEGPEIQNIEPDWMRVRQNYGLLSYGTYYNNWEAMPWPAGL